MSDRCLHYFRVVLQVRDARSCPFVVVGLVDGPDDGVVQERGAVCDSWFHRAVEWAGEQLCVCVKSLLYCVLESRRGGPLVDGDVLPTLWVEGYCFRVVPEH